MSVDERPSNKLTSYALNSVQRSLTRVGSSVTIIFSGSSLVNNGVSIQVGNQGDLKETLENIPPEALDKLIKAIA